MKRVIFFLIILIFGVVTAVSHQYGAVRAEEDAPEEVNDYIGPAWFPPVQLTTTSNGGKLPALTTAPNGQSVMVAYVRQMSTDPNDTVAYFRESNNRGETWSGATAIGVNNANEVADVDVAYDGNNQAHAVWSSLLDPGIEIYYAKESGWPASPAAFSATFTDEGIIDTPSIAAIGNTIYIIWAESQDDPLTEIYYRRSTNGGDTWSTSALIAETNNISRSPQIDVSNDGKIHVAWQEGEFPLPTTIQYSQGIVQGSVVNWSPAVQISNPADAGQVLSPELAIEENIVHVAYTNRLEENVQFVNHSECAANCTTASSWRFDSAASGQALKEDNTNPFIVKSTITQKGKCTLLYYHGIQQNQNTERIFGVDSCRQWGALGRDEVTPINLASINPDMGNHNNWFIYLAYEDVASDGTRTVWFVRNDVSIYAPFALRAN